MFPQEELKKEENEELNPLTIIVKRMKLNFNDDQASTVINLTDISTYIKLKKEDGTN